VDSIFNQYNTDIAKERLELLANKIIDTCKRNDVNTLHIGLLGDFITGIIHGSTIAQAQEDLIDQIINVSNLLSYFCGYIAEQIPNVNVYVVYGNHERSTQGKSDRAYKENFGRLIAVILKKDLKNICKVIDNGYEDFVQFTLENGKTVVMTHGTNDSVESANNNFSKLLHTDVYRVYMGHLHDVKESRGTLVNGSIMGGDDYSISKRLNSKPTQLLEIYYKGTDDYSTYRFVL
jgi:DNA repair exonuclease SbcCD nuclease subunit